MPLYAEFSGDTERFRFEVDDDGVIWNPPIPVAQWLVGYPVPVSGLRRRKTVLLGDVLLAHHRTSYSRVVRIEADGTQVPQSTPMVLAVVDVRDLSHRAARVVSQVGELSDNAPDDSALETLGDRGWPVPEQEWDLLRQALEARRTTKQQERIKRVQAALREGGPEQAQALLDRLLDLNEDDRAMLNRRIRQWPHRLRRRTANGLLSRRRRPGPSSGDAETGM